jgi:hypothetical protein
MKDMKKKERNEAALRGSISAAEGGMALFIHNVAYLTKKLIEISKYKRQFIGDPKGYVTKHVRLITADLTCAVFSARTFRI